LDALALMEQAALAARADAGAERVLAELEQIVVVQGVWRYPDPGRGLAQRVGAVDAASSLTPNGGNSPQSAVSALARSIQAGDLDLAMVVGGEVVHTRHKCRAADVTFAETDQGDIARAPMFGTELGMSSDHESERGFSRPAVIYPLFESAIRAHRGETHPEHRARIGRLWEGLNRVAVDNPYAWVRTPMRADDIITPGPDNRMVGYPYTKAMNSNWFVNQGAAVIVCSSAKAAALGVSRDRWVFVHSGADACATTLFSRRDDFHSSPAIGESGRAALRLAGAGIDDVAVLDLYSCFPSAVQLTMGELGIGGDRIVTTTGGMSFAGGPLNNYVTHAVATLVDRVRTAGLGLVHGNGGYATKEAFGIYGTEPPAHGYRHADVQDRVDAYPSREVDEGHTGPATVEAYTVLHDTDGPERALITLLNDSGQRVLAGTTDADAMAALVADEYIGTSVTVAPGGVVELN
ncbi:MAG: hypothetical protein OEU32_12455, partial [Acidimicrobiia bacterium]|nr:hypothetical protein [Acidimicrobiia bacterium]